MWHLFLMNKRKHFYCITRVSFVCLCIHGGCRKLGRRHPAVLWDLQLLQWRYHRAVNKLNTSLRPSLFFLSTSLWPIQPLSFQLGDVWQTMCAAETQERPVNFLLVYSSTGKHDDWHHVNPRTERRSDGHKETVQERHPQSTPAQLSDTLPTMRHCLSTNVESVGVNQPFICR